MINYLENGGAIYMDGAEVGPPQQDALTAYLGFERFTRGDEFAIEYYSGKPNTLGEGFVLDYQYQTIADYMLDTLMPTTGGLFFNSSDGRARGIFNIGEAYRTITVAGIFGAIADTDEYNNKANLMSKYLDYLLMRVPDLFPIQSLNVNLGNGVIIWEEPMFMGLSDTFESYNIYLDGELTDENIIVNAYQLQYLNPNEEYTIGIQAVYAEGNSAIIDYTFTFVGLDAEDDIISVNRLIGNYPNPFNPTTTISFNLGDNAGNTRLEIYNSKGEKVKTLVDEHLSAGKHNIVWDGKNDRGLKTTSGVYLYKIMSGRFTSTKKMILLK